MLNIQISAIIQYLFIFIFFSHTNRYFSMLCYAKLLQSCPTLCDPIDGSPPGSSIPGILQARTLEWVAISFSNAWKWKVKVKSPSRVRLSATPWTAAFQAPLSVGFSRQEYWSGVPLPSPYQCLFKLTCMFTGFLVCLSMMCLWFFICIWNYFPSAWSILCKFL